MCIVIIIVATVKQVCVCYCGMVTCRIVMGIRISHAVIVCTDDYSVFRLSYFVHHYLCHYNELSGDCN